MEDFGDIIFYIIAAVIGLATTLGKKKKKPAQKPTTTAESSDNQPFEHDMEEGVPEIEYQVSEEDFRMDEIFSEPAAPEPIAEEKMFSPDLKQEGKYSEPLQEELVSEGKKQINIEENQEEESIDETIEENDLIRDFDLREAIIYSEILKRKDY